MSYKRHDICVVGRGLAGLCTAFGLVVRGLKPVILGIPETNASQVGQGIASTKGLLVPESSLFRSKLAGQHYLPTFIEKIQHSSGVNVRSYQNGFLEPYSSPSEFLKISKRVFRFQHWGAFGSSNVPSEELGHPYLMNSYIGAIHYPKDVWVHQGDLLNSLEAALAARGATFHYHSVDGIEMMDGGYLLKSRSSEPILADQVCVCAGPGTSKILKPLGFDRQLSMVHGMTIEGNVEASDIALLERTNSLVIREGRFFLGASSWKEGQNEGLPTSVLEDDLWQSSGIFGLLGRREELRGLTSKIGTRVRTRNREPLMGWMQPTLASRPIWVLTGLFKSGLQLAPHLGDELAAGIVASRTQSPPIDLRL